MRKLLGLFCAFAWALLCLSAAGAAAKKTAPARKAKTATSKKTPAKAKSGARTAGKKTAASKSRKKAPARTTWRNRQTAPTPERYKQIQDALASRGFMDPAEANGAWGQRSADALKKFQAAQNIESTGKINSLSLIALGLGPKREAAAAKPADPPPPAHEP